MLLSICIPTYNRCQFLKKNLEELAGQIKSCGALNDVELNVSDNGSTDETDKVVKEFIANHSEITVGYNHFDNNQGPDKNYISTMHMAHGNYTILLGDDDFLIKEGLALVFRLLKENNSIDVFLSNRIEINESGDFLREQFFLSEDIPSRVFDFSDENQAGFYFSLCKSVGGCLTFISSIIYKTSILQEIGDYDGKLDGTYYSFWFYLWGKLSKGGKLYYYNKSYILNTQTFNTNFGLGLNRSLVEFEGFQRAAELFFADKTYKYTFLEIPKRCKPMYMLIQECINDKKSYYSRLIPVLEKSGQKGYVDDIKKLFSVYFQLGCVANLILPRWIMRWYHKLHK